MGDGVPHLAERLELLFRTVPRELGGAQLHTSESLADALRDIGVDVTPTHLANLRAGRRDNPSALLLEGIARVFDVPLTYFFDDAVAGEVSPGLRTLAALRDEGIQQLMLRMQGLSPENLEIIASVVTQLRRAQGLDDGPREVPRVGPKGRGRES